MGKKSKPTIKGMLWDVLIILATTLLLIQAMLAIYQEDRDSAQFYVILYIAMELSNRSHKSK